MALKKDCEFFYLLVMDIVQVTDILELEGRITSLNKELKVY